MIFNPLFLNETGNSKLLVPTSTKLSKNKYLFSDIVKVVMNPINDSQKASGGSENLLAFQSGLKLSDDQIPIQLKLNFLKDVHTEKTEKTLLELLPNEIAKLFIENKNKTEDKSAVSFLSKEILDGELEAFVGKLLGIDFIKKHLSADSGLLLSLEDKTSAVNFELAQVDSKTTSNPKIAVQTIVVPFKSKLISQFREAKSDNAFFRFNGNEVLKLNTTNTPKLNPSISVFSFELGTENFHSLTQNLKSSKNLAQSSEVNKLNTPLTNENKNNSIKANHLVGQKLDGNLLKKNLVKANLFQLPKKTSDFTVNNITILKKALNNSEIEKHNGAELNKRFLDNAKVLTKNNINEVQNKSTLTNPDSNSLQTPKNNYTEKNISINGVEKEKISQQTIVNKVEVGKTANSSDLNKGITSNELGTTNSKVKNSISEVKTTVSQSESTNNEKTTNSNISDKENSFKESDNSSIKNSNKFGEIKDLTKEKFSNLNQLNSESIKEEALEKIKTANQNSGKNEQNDTIKSSRNIDTTTKDDFVPKKTNDLSSKEETVMKEKILSEEKRTAKQDAYSEIGKEESNLRAQINNSTLGVVENINEKMKKKELSVKVNGEIRSVSEKKSNPKVNSNSGANSENSTSSQENASLKNESIDNLQQGPKMHGDLANSENSFSNTLNNFNNTQQSSLSGTQVISTENSAERIVRSVEIIKELTEFITKNEKGSLTFNIKPEHLGQLKITLETIDNAIKARIEVENEQAKQLLERNIDKLHQELIDNGVKLNSLNIALSNSRRQKDDKELKNKLHNNSKNLGQVGESEEEAQKKSLGYNTYEYIA